MTKANITEETIRGYINQMLELFGWNILNTNEIVQEKKLIGSQRERLRQINSNHTKPDYQLRRGTSVLAFLDAKDLNVDIFEDSSVAFQIRSYGWSAQVPCSFVSNFEQFVIYDCRFVPDPTQLTNFGTVLLTKDQYVEKFDFLYELLNKENVYNGKLREIYEVQADQGEQSLDIKFMRILSDFRLKLARNLFKNNSFLRTHDLGDLNYYVQLILDRIVFIRVCESRGIEEDRLLNNFIKRGFWNSFKQSCYMEFYDHYDGAMFERNETYQKIILDDGVFIEFIEKLYYPSPYRFDAIPVAILAEIYEYFLAKKIVLSNERVSEEWKDLYLRTQGAISTPKHIVDYICEETIKPATINSIDELLAVRILEPACGSGTFLITAYELLERRLIELFKKGIIPEVYKQWFIVQDTNVFLAIEGKKELMKKCIYGIDIDETAIEVTKMSLALKIIDDNIPILLDQIGLFGDKILENIHQNIVNGNTLVENEIVNLDVPEKELYDANPLDISVRFEDVISNGGFTFIIGNPPYVEPKHYRALFPNIYTYIKDKYVAASGKGDISLYFVKRSLDLISPNGKVGFIMQKRFFKTEYGNKIRDYLASNGYIEQIVDFKSTNIFKGRITYVAFMLLSKKLNHKLQYNYIMPDDPIEVRTIVESRNLSSHTTKNLFIPKDFLVGRNWSFDIFFMRELLQSMRERGMTPMSSIPNFSMKTGVQLLWKKIYQIDNCVVEHGIITGTNQFGDRVHLEQKITKPLIRNKKFYSFKDATTKTYILFPYKGPNNNELITMSELANEFPLAYEYLITNETLIKQNVKFFNDSERWHGYTRVQNHNLYNQSKILMPMTSKDTIASFIHDECVFADNANMWQIIIENASQDLMKAISCIINSTTFSALAKVEANPQQNDNFKFNKQFVEPVLFPYENLLSKPELINELAVLHDEIKRQQLIFLDARPRDKQIARLILRTKWSKIDEITDELYTLTAEESEFFKSQKRSDRIFND